MLWVATAHLLVVAGAGSGAEDLHCTVLCRKLLVFVEGFVRWPALLSLRPFCLFHLKKEVKTRQAQQVLEVAAVLHCC